MTRPALIPWAIEPGHLAQLRALGPGEDYEHMPQPRPGYEVVAGVARIRIDGPLANDWWCCTSYEDVRIAVRRAAADFTARSIALIIDSPGGSVAGVHETVATIAQVRTRKRVLAYVSGMACSAAYWLASACEEIVCAPTALTGCLGVMLRAADWSKAMDEAGVRRIVIRSQTTPRKSPDVGTSEWEVEAQSLVDVLADEMLADIARNRKVSPDTVRNDYGQGATLAAAAALAAGLIDRIAGPDDTWITVGGPPPVRYLTAPSTPLRASTTAAGARPMRGGTMQVQTEALSDGKLAISAQDLSALQAAADEREKLVAERDAAAKAKAEADDRAAAQGDITAALKARVERLEHDAKAKAESEAKSRTEQVISAALGSGRITPADAPKWRERAARFGADEVAAMLDDLRPESAAPTQRVTVPVSPTAADRPVDTRAALAARIAQIQIAQPGCDYEAAYRQAKEAQ